MVIQGSSPEVVEQAWADYAAGVSGTETATVEPTAEPAVPEVSMSDVMAELKALREQFSEKDGELAVVKQQLDEQRIANANSGQPTVAMDTFIRLRTDRPALSIDEKLDCMEASARDNNEPFDRERTRKILAKEPVEDANKWVFMGHAFDTEEEMVAYKNKVTAEQDRTLGKYPR